MITQIPVLIEPLHKLNYPHADVLNRELSDGFPLLGRLQPGLQWRVRDDNKYKQPQTMQDLRTYNREYIVRKLTQAHVDTHCKMMAEEIATEVALGQMRGPLRSTTDWFRMQTTHLQISKHTLHKQPIPHRDPIIAMAFSIHQTGSDGTPKM